ncbi:MAG: CRISPR-associated protein Cas4 [Bryobacteraceae bacterium]
MIYFIVISFIVLLVGLVALSRLRAQQQRFGVLTNTRIYSDTAERPGKTLYAKSVNLVGKPDYLIEQNGVIIPVEVKTGRTPSTPYMNHTMQLLAYCLLVEENYKRPPGGYLRYPDKEYQLAYTDEAKASVIALVREISELKRTNIEQHCKHSEHYRDTEA